MGPDTGTRMGCELRNPGVHGPLSAITSANAETMSSPATAAITISMKTSRSLTAAMEMWIGTDPARKTQGTREAPTSPPN